MKPTEDRLSRIVRTLLGMADRAKTARGASWEHGARSATTLEDAVSLIEELHACVGELLEAKNAEIAALREVLPAGPFVVDPGTGLTQLQQAESRADYLLNQYEQAERLRQGQRDRANAAEARVMELEVDLKSVRDTWPELSKIDEVIAERDKLRSQVAQYEAAEKRYCIEGDYAGESAGEGPPLILAMQRMHAAVTEVAAQRDKYREQLTGAKPDKAPKYDRDAVVRSFISDYEGSVLHALEEYPWSLCELASICEAVCTAMLRERGL